jgi:hypothetical protein
MKVTIPEIVDVLFNVVECHTGENIDGCALTDPEVNHINILVGRIQKHGIQQDYVPMTDDEWAEYLGDDTSLNLSYSFYKEIEQHIRNRSGVAPSLDQAKAICEANGFSVVPKSIELDYAKAVCNANGIATNVPLVSYDKRSKLEAAKKVK